MGIKQFIPETFKNRYSKGERRAKRMREG
jgi:hypothetical protein